VGWSPACVGNPRWGYPGRLERDVGPGGRVAGTRHVPRAEKTGTEHVPRAEETRVGEMEGP
jgi:hypothetical protein